VFSSKSKTDGNVNVSAIPSSNAFNTLAVGTVIEGNVRSASDIRVDGSIFGNLTCDSKIIIGPSGIIEGDVSCASAHIEGKYKGKLTVGDILNIRENAIVTGDIITQKLIVQAGASFNGTCVMKNK
jgi:cytoskeletal protein CcmA (bactofilin family)